jgi:DNA polymerase III alpha subunit
MNSVLSKNGLRPIDNRLEEVENNPFFIEECNIISEMKNGFAYYKHIIENVEVKSNSKNSYVLWVCGKCDDLDKTKPVKFIKGNYSLPDIDVDFPPEIREDVIQYLRDKYSSDRVCQMITFGRLQGKSILKEVLRVNDRCSPEQMNQITKYIPDEAEISDELKDMERPSILMWSLENTPKELSDYCWIDEDGSLKGEYARDFEQAIRLEGTYKSQGKHAAGVVISLDLLNEVCPMIKEARGNAKIAGMEMGDLEAIGCTKFDILGVSLLSKIQMTCEGIGDYE